MNGSLQVTTRLSFTLTSDFPSFTQPVVVAPMSSSYAAGTAAGSIDGGFARTVTATTSGASLTLNDGSLKDPFGGSVILARLSTLHVYNPGTASLTLGGNFILRNFGTAGATIDPLGTFLIDAPGSNGRVVTTGQTDTLTLTSAVGTIGAQVTLAGRSV